MSHTWLLLVFGRFHFILQGGGTSCTDVESVNFNTEGSNTASVVNSVGKFYCCETINMRSENWSISWSLIVKPTTSFVLVITNFSQYRYPE